MPRKLIKRYTPTSESIKTNRYLSVFGRLLHDPMLWHLNRRSVSSAFANGLFWAMLPIPAQMLGAGFSAILFRTNMPIAVALVWLTNPLTMPPIFYFNYLIGNLVLGSPESTYTGEFTLESVKEQLSEIWLPLYTGSFVVGIVLAILGYLGMRLFWRWQIARYLKNRKKRKN